MYEVTKYPPPKKRPKKKQGNFLVGTEIETCGGY